MTTLYRPVLIKTAEQAEALPVGTVAHDRDHGTEPDLIPYVKVTPRFWVSVWDVSDDHELDVYGVCPNSHMVGDSALVPIEAEERKGYVGGKHTKTRLATAVWAIASISWLLTAHKADSAPLIGLYVLFAIASGYVALIHRDKENR